MNKEQPQKATPRQMLAHIAKLAAIGQERGCLEIFYVGLLGSIRQLAESLPPREPDSFGALIAGLGRDGAMAAWGRGAEREARVEPSDGADWARNVLDMVDESAEDHLRDHVAACEMASPLPPGESAEARPIDEKTPPSGSPVSAGSTAMEVLPIDAFEKGWRTAAVWAHREDLYADIGSPAYLRDRRNALNPYPCHRCGITDEKAMASCKREDCPWRCDPLPSDGL